MLCLGDGFGGLFFLEADTNTCNFGRLVVLYFVKKNTIFRKLDLDCSLFPGRLLAQFKQGEKTRTTKRLKNILVKQTIQNLYVLCWFLLAAVCLQMSGKWSTFCENSEWSLLQLATDKVSISIFI